MPPQILALLDEQPWHLVGRSECGATWARRVTVDGVAYGQTCHCDERPLSRAEREEHAAQAQAERAARAAAERAARELEWEREREREEERRAHAAWKQEEEREQREQDEWAQLRQEARERARGAAAPAVRPAAPAVRPASASCVTRSATASRGRFQGLLD